MRRIFNCVMFIYFQIANHLNGEVASGMRGISVATCDQRKCKPVEIRLMPFPARLISTNILVSLVTLV